MKGTIDDWASDLERDLKALENWRGKTEVSCRIINPNVASIIIMDFFDGRYYRINKILLSCIGLWPYQRNAVKYAIVTVLCVVSTTQFTAKICGVLVSLSDSNAVMDSLPPLIIDFVSGLKLLNSIFNANKIRTLMDRCKANWLTLTTDEELKIFETFAEKGRKFTVIYAGAIYSAMTIFMGMPFLPVLLNHSSVNASNRPMVHNVEYFIDMQVFYYPIILHAYMTIIICTSIIIALDAMFVIFVQHACGLFCAVGYRLEHVADNQKLFVDVCPPIHKDEPYRVIVECAHRHIRAIENLLTIYYGGLTALSIFVNFSVPRFADLIESSCTMLHFFQAGFNMIIISITGAQAVLNIDNPHEFVRQVILVCAQMCHLFFESFQAQRLIDHSLQLQQNLLNAKWYQSSLRTRKVINFMIMRSQVPSTLSAGGLMVLCMETFCVIVRSSVSYFTMLRTFQ